MGNNSLLQYANYLIILSVCVDQGDGRWKEMDKENFRHDIADYKKIAEKLEHEMEAFYEEYPDGWLNTDNIGRTHYKYLTNLLNRDIDTTKGSQHKDEEKHNFSIVTGGASVHQQSFEEKSNTLKVSQKVKDANNYLDRKFRSTEWPKFDDILRAIGKKYDWKNDRWIKVKEKPKQIRRSNEVIHVKDDERDEKHRFSYKLIKLNRGKNRRNVVVAVSAVR